MFIEITDRRGNIISLNTTHIGYFYTKVEPYPSCVCQMQGGKVMTAEFETMPELEDFVQKLIDAGLGGGLKQVDTYADLPQPGNKGVIYITKDTGQTYYWDPITLQYVKAGTSGKTGVYSTDTALPETVGSSITINKSDLVEILKPSVDYSEGSEIIGNNNVHGIIVGSDATTVTVKTITDLTIDNFQQVETLADLPPVNTPNILYYVKDIDEFRVWDDTTKTWVEPSHPIVYGDIALASAEPETFYVVDNVIKYTLDNSKWFYIGAIPEPYTDKIIFDGVSDTFDVPSVVEGKRFNCFINGVLNFEDQDYTVDRTVTPNRIKFDTIYDTFDTCNIVYLK